MNRKEAILKIINDNVFLDDDGKLDEKVADEIEKLFQPEWRAVREELPETNELVLICNAQGYRRACLYYELSPGQFRFDCQETVTRWMPLPAPPENKQED
jgi:hypothetical protein